METNIPLKLFQERSILFQSFDRFTTTIYKNRPPELLILWREVESSMECQPFSLQAKIRV